MQDKRNELQNNALSAWIKNNKKGTIEIATGLGKTFIALNALYSMPKDDKIHLYLAEVSDRKKDLLETIKKYDNINNCDTINDYNLQFHCYQSVRNWRNKENIGLVISDEIHDSLTPEYSKFYQYNNYDAIIGLSAKIDINTSYIEKRGVLTYTINKKTYLNRYCPIVFKYDINEARSNNLNRNLTIHLIKHKLDDSKKNIKSGSKTNPFYQTEKKAYYFWDNRFKEAILNSDSTKRNIFSRIAASKRANILYKLESKIDACRKLLKIINRVIIFGNDIDSLLKVTPYVISSRNSNDKNEYFRSRFENNLIDNIGSFKKLKQGANLKNLNNCIIMSYYSKEKDLIQRFGRIRNNNNTGNIFIFITEDTKEDQWFESMFKNIKNIYKVINHDNINSCIKFLKK